MATRSVIAKLNKETKEIKAIYCHNDGYLAHVGTVLDSHYQDEDKLDELLAHGDLSSLDENIGEKINFGDIELRRNNKQCMFYARDRDEPSIAHTLEDETALLKHAFEKCDAQYVYLYAYGAWYVYDMENDNQFRELDDILHKVYNK